MTIHPPTRPEDTHLAELGAQQPPVPAWPEFTNLVQEDDGSYKQTSQTPEINACLGAAVKRANANLVLIDSFPDIDDQEHWLVDALNFELTVNQSRIVNVVGERARADDNYFNCLLSMVIVVPSTRSHGLRSFARLVTAGAATGRPH